MNRACGLAGRRDLGAVAHVDDERALGDHLLRLRAGDFRDGGVGGFEELFGGGGHGVSFREAARELRRDHQPRQL